MSPERDLHDDDDDDDRADDDHDDDDHDDDDDDDDDDDGGRPLACSPRTGCPRRAFLRAWHLVRVVGVCHLERAL